MHEPRPTVFEYGDVLYTFFDRISVPPEDAGKVRCALCGQQFTAGAVVWSVTEDCLTDTAWGWGYLCDACQRRVLREGIPVGAEIGQG